MTEGRKDGWASKIEPGFLLSSKSGSATAVSIYAQDQFHPPPPPSTLLMRNSSAKLKSVAYCVKLRMFEFRMTSWHWMKMNILVVSLIVWTKGIRQQHESQLRLEKMCQKRPKHLMKSFKCDPQRQQCEPHGLDEHRDPEINHYNCSTLTNDTNMSTVD